MDRVERDKFNAPIGSIQNNIQIWGQYDRLIDFIYDEFPKTKRRFEEIAFPTLFVLSHGIELALKENIIFFKEYHGCDRFKKHNDWNCLLKSHNLKNLAIEFKYGYRKLHKIINAPSGDMVEFLRYCKKLDELIAILNRNTETYRYSIKLDKYGNFNKRSVKGLVKIDFYKIKELLIEIRQLFLGAPNSISKYTDFIDYKRGNPRYKIGKGYLYCPRLSYDKDFLSHVEETMTENCDFSPNQIWINRVTGEKYEIKVWDKHIYIIAI